MMDITLKEGIEEIITNEIPEVKEVRNIDWFITSLFFLLFYL
jgi:Fe-S cluster biogenesis protein NfuA